MQQPHRHTGVTRVGQAPLPLDHNRIVSLGRQHQSLGRARDEVGHHRVHRAAVSLNQHPGLPRGHELGFATAPDHAARQLHADHHLAHATVVAHGVQPQAVRVERVEPRHVVLVIFAEIHQRRATALGQA